MAYSAFKKAMTANEKKTAWNVLEGFPSFRAKMRLKEKFSCGMRKRTYDWFKKVEDKAKNQTMTFSDFTALGAEACNICLENAFEIREDVPPPDPPPKPKPSSARRPVREEDYFSCSSGNDDDDDDDDSSLDEDQMNELNAAFNKLGFGGKELGNAFGKSANVMASGLGSMMEGMLNGLFDKNGNYFLIIKKRHDDLENYLREHKDTIPANEMEEYKKMLSILHEMVAAFDKFEGSPKALQTELQRLDAEQKRLKLSYPGAIEVDPQEMTQQLLGGMFGGAKDAECSVM